MSALLFCSLTLVLGAAHARNLTFPDGFLFGAGTAAYQVEGAWNESGRGESIWDKYLQTKGSCIADKSIPLVAADSYHKYKEDIKALKEVGFNVYRFSIAWTRILPEGDVSTINQAGIDYYNSLINEVVSNGLVPVVTMYHWDLPQHIQELGGLASPAVIDFFQDYARVLFTHFGDRVKWWITFNEPMTFVNGYNGGACTAPGADWPGFGDYLVGHNILKAHARVYHMYDEEFRSKQNGKISITLNTAYAQPKTNSSADVEAADSFLQFSLGWFGHPIYSKEGDYPAVMKERIANNSKAEGLYRSRLPEFDEYWVKYIRGTADFFGLNYYSSVVVGQATSSNERATRMTDLNVYTGYDPSWVISAAYWLTYTPANMRKILKWVSDQYDNIPIMIMENGWADKGGLNDTTRSRYFMNHFAYLLDAIYLDKVNVVGFNAWSIIDTWEWENGFTIKFGLYQIDFSDPEKKRVAKNSASVLAKMIKNNKVVEEYLDEDDQ